MVTMETPALLPDYQPWETKDTVDYLTVNPLPPDFLWTDDTGAARPVYPSHKSVTGYGKWLKETPYFPGLFELIHKILVHAPDLGDGNWMAAELRRRRPPEQKNFPLI